MTCLRLSLALLTCSLLGVGGLAVPAAAYEPLPGLQEVEECERWHLARLPGLNVALLPDEKRTRPEAVLLFPDEPMDDEEQRELAERFRKEFQFSRLARLPMAEPDSGIVLLDGSVSRMKPEREERWLVEGLADASPLPVLASLRNYLNKKPHHLENATLEWAGDMSGKAAKGVSARMMLGQKAPRALEFHSPEQPMLRAFKRMGGVQFTTGEELAKLRRTLEGKYERVIGYIKRGRQPILLVQVGPRRYRVGTDAALQEFERLSQLPEFSFDSLSVQEWPSERKARLEREAREKEERERAKNQPAAGEDGKKPEPQGDKPAGLTPDEARRRYAERLRGL